MNLKTAFNAKAQRGKGAERKDWGCGVRHNPISLRGEEEIPISTAGFFCVSAPLRLCVKFLLRELVCNGISMKGNATYV